MRKKELRRTALLLAAALTAGSALAGCADSADTTAAAGTGSAGAQSAAAESGAEQEEAVSYGSISVMTYDRGTISSSEGDMTDNRWTRWINENAPFDEVTFVAVPKAEAVQTMTNLFSAGEGPDVVATYEDTSSFVSNGMALEITDEMLDLMPNYKKMLEEYPIIDKLCKVDGKRYLVGKFETVLPNHTIVIRKDWLDNLGLSMPETTEDLIEICRAFTEDDPDGNGVDDTWGISMTTDTQRVLSHMWGFPNPEKYAMVDGELTYVWDRIESWLEFCKTLTGNGYVNPDFLTMSGDDDRADFLNGRIGIYASGKFTQVNTTIYSDFKKSNPDGELDTFVLPATEYGSYTGYTNGGPSIVGFINAETDNVEGALAYINWLYDPDVSEYLMYGEDGVYYQKDEEGTYVVVDAEKNAVEFNYSSDYSIIKNQLLTGSDKAVSLHANDYYNQYLKNSDEVMHEFGDLYYKMCLIANDTEASDPRKWLQALPVLPTELNVIEAVADSQVNDILKAALADKSITAQEAVENAKSAWYDAGGEQVDAYYAQYYAEAGSDAMLMEDFYNLKDQPDMTPLAQENSRLAQEGKLSLR